MIPFLDIRHAAVPTMKLSRLWITVVAALCVGQHGPSSAAGGQMKTEGLPASKFNDADYALMMARVNQALRAEKDGETLDWKSDKTPASGSVMALNRLEWQGLPCRRLRIYNAYGDLKARGTYKFCEKPAGRWKLIGPD